MSALGVDITYQLVRQCESLRTDKRSRFSYIGASHASPKVPISATVP